MAHVGPFSPINQILSRDTESTATQSQSESQVKEGGQNGKEQTPPIHANTTPTFHRLPKEILQQFTNYFPNGSKDLQLVGSTSRALHDAVRDRLKTTRLLSRVAKLHTKSAEERPAEIDAIATEVNDNKVQLVTADQIDVFTALVNTLFSFSFPNENSIVDFTHVCSIAAHIENPAVKEKIATTLTEVLFFLPEGKATSDGFDHVRALATAITNSAVKQQITAQAQAVVNLKKELSAFINDGGGIDDLKRICNLAGSNRFSTVKTHVATTLAGRLVRGNFPQEADLIAGSDHVWNLVFDIEDSKAKTQVAPALIKKLCFFPREARSAAFERVWDLVADIEDPEAKRQVVLALINEFSLLPGEARSAAIERVCNFAADIEDSEAKGEVGLALIVHFFDLPKEYKSAAFKCVCDLAADIEDSKVKGQVGLALIKNFSYLSTEAISAAFKRVCNLAADIEDSKAKGQVVLALIKRVHLLREAATNAICERLFDLVAGIKDPEAKAKAVAGLKEETFYFKGDERSAAVARLAAIEAGER